MLLSVTRTYVYLASGTSELDSGPREFRASGEDGEAQIICVSVVTASARYEFIQFHPIVRKVRNVVTALFCLYI